MGGALAILTEFKTNGLVSLLIFCRNYMIDVIYWQLMWTSFMQLIEFYLLYMCATQWSDQREKRSICSALSICYGVQSLNQI